MQFTNPDHYQVVQLWLGTYFRERPAVVIPSPDTDNEALVAFIKRLPFRTEPCARTEPMSVADVVSATVIVIPCVDESHAYRLFCSIPDEGKKGYFYALLWDGTRIRTENT